MITKRIDRSGKTSSFEKLGKYVLEAKQSDAAILWTRTAEYVVDLNGAGEKVLWARLTHCEAEIPVLAIAEIEATQAQNTRSKVDKTYHLVISFPEGERPNRTQLEDIEDAICAALGFAEHQRISAVHQDTDNLHLHLAINKVHPQTLNIQEPYRDFYTLSETCRKLEQKHGLQVDHGIGEGQNKGRAADLEAHSGQQSLLSWIQESLGEPLKQCLATGQSWEDLHQVLTAYGLVIKPRGAGLVIATQDGTLGVKASAVDRGLSFKSLSDRWGDYQPPQQALEQTKIENGSQNTQGADCYQSGPRQRHPRAGSLWGQYQKEKEVVFQARAQALESLRVAHTQYTIQLKDWYRERRASVKTNPQLTAPSRRALYQELFQEMKADLAARQALDVDQRRAIRAQYAGLSWQAWLVQQSEQGNTDAFGVLRSRQQVRKRLAQALLTAEDIDSAKQIIHPHLRPSTRQNGDVLYRLKDGGLVEDAAHAVHVPEVTEAATLLALTLASERFPGRPLQVEGSPAAVQGLALNFADENLEKTRERLVLARELKMQQAGRKASSNQPKARIDNPGHTR